MNPDKNLKKISNLEKIAFPNYVSELQRTMALLNSHVRPIRAFSELENKGNFLGGNFNSELGIISQLQKNYMPIGIAFPNRLYSELMDGMHGIKQISETLKTSLSDLSAHQYDIADCIKEDFEEDKLIELIDSTKIILNDIYYNNDLIDIVDPREFEKIIAELLHFRGYEVQLTKRTRDGGYDVLALRKIGGIPFKILAECKRHKKTIGIDIIRSFCDVITTEKANKGLIFTTSYFSKPAIDRKESMGTILDFKNRDEIIEWIIDYHNK